MIIIVYSIQWFSLVFLPLFVVYYFIQRVFVPTFRQSQRIESKVRSPMISHFKESVQGRRLRPQASIIHFSGQSSIRAFGKTGEFLRKNEALRDNFLRVTFTRDHCAWWLHSRLDIISSIVVFVTVVFAVYGRGKISTGDVALAINYCLR